MIGSLKGFFDVCKVHEDHSQCPAVGYARLRESQTCAHKRILCNNLVLLKVIFFFEPY